MTAAAAAAAYFLLLGEWEGPSGCVGRGLEISIPTWREAHGEGRRGLARVRKEAGETMRRQREVRSGSDVSVGAVRGRESAQLTWKVAKEPPIRGTSSGLALEGQEGRGFSVFWLGRQHAWPQHNLGRKSWASGTGLPEQMWDKGSPLSPELGAPPSSLLPVSPSAGSFSDL